MKLYRFKTFRTSYFFPRMTKELEYMYGLYPTYGGKLSRIYWWLFRHCSIVRRLNACDGEKAGFPYKQIVELEGRGSLMAFNLGTPGPEQKISILGFDEEKKEPFFAKYSEKPGAIAFTKNEAATLQVLKGTNLAPELFEVKELDDCIWMRTSFVQGKHLSSMALTEEIVDLALSLSKYHLSDQTTNEEGLRLSLSHGDFCPWNMLVNEGQLQLIDWEMAADRPLGYDIFKYVCQISLLFTPEKPLIETIKENQTLINNYFTQCGIENWDAYRNEFLRVFSKNAK